MNFRCWVVPLQTDCGAWEWGISKVTWLTRPSPPSPPTSTGRLWWRDKSRVVCKAGGSLPVPEGVTPLSFPLPIYLSYPLYSVNSPSSSLSVGSMAMVTLAWLEAGSWATNTPLERIRQSGPTVWRQIDSLDGITIRCDNFINLTELCIFKFCQAKLLEEQ